MAVSEIQNVKLECIRHASNMIQYKLNILQQSKTQIEKDASADNIIKEAQILYDFLSK